MEKSPRPRRYSVFGLSWSDISTSAQFALNVASTMRPTLFHSGVSLIRLTWSEPTLPILFIVIPSLIFLNESVSALATYPRPDTTNPAILVGGFHSRRPRMSTRQPLRHLFVGDSKSAPLYGQVRSGERSLFDLIGQVSQVHDSLEIQLLLRHGLTPSWVQRRREPHVKLHHHPVVTGIRLVKTPTRLNGDDGYPFDAVGPTSDCPSCRWQRQPNRPGEVVSLFVRRRPAVELHPSAGECIGVTLLVVLVCCDDAVGDDRQRLTLRYRQGINAVADDGRHRRVVKELPPNRGLDHAAILLGEPPRRYAHARAATSLHGLETPAVEVADGQDRPPPVRSHRRAQVRLSWVPRRSNCLEHHIEMIPPRPNGGRHYAATRRKNAGRQ